MRPDNETLVCLSQTAKLNKCQSFTLRKNRAALRNQLIVTIGMSEMFTVYIRYKFSLNYYSIIVTELFPTTTPKSVLKLV